MAYRILIVDDEDDIREFIGYNLRREGYEVYTATNGAEALEVVGSVRPHLILLDMMMPEMDGMEFLHTYRSSCSQQGVEDAPVVMITGHGSVDNAVEALKSGAFDFIQKPLDLNRLLLTTKHALDHKSLVQETKVLRKKIGKRNQMIGNSPAISRVRAIIDKVAATEARVLITGANGTGKEVVAHLIHENSTRAKGALVEVNCAAIPSELIESELFGHTKGSFTSAIKDRAGKFEQADGGTLFLDEIGDMSLSAQAKVLRALQENEITRVGSDKPIKVNVRVIAATNKDLQKEIAEGRFREDLFHRLNVIPIQVPDLKDRKEDIPLLVNHFIQLICAEQGWKTKSITEEAIQSLQQHHWPGNIRELRNVVERLIILSGDTITAEDVNLYV